MVKEACVQKCVEKVWLVEQSLFEWWTTKGDMKMWEGPIGRNCLPVCGHSSDTVLASNGTKVPDNIDNNELWISEKFVAKSNQHRY